MRLFIAVAAIALSAVFVAAEDHLVTVGDGGSLLFDPTTITAVEGDTITFSFRAKNHTVTQSTFADPCTIMTTPKQGIDSGFAPVAEGATMLPQWQITIDNASTPLWFFCAQTNHCSSGMVFAVNPPAEGNTFDAFLNAATGGAASGSGAVSSTGTVGGSSTGGGSLTASATASGDAATNTDNGALSLGAGQTSLLAIISLLAGLML